MLASLYEEMFALIFMAVALGMDAFSISLGIGMQRIRLKRIFIIGIIIGLFHVLMPSLGILTGKLISFQIGGWAEVASGFLLFAIGAHMIFAAFNYESKQMFNISGLGLLFFGISVSMDSFSVGLSLGMSELKIILTILVFGSVSTVMTWAGLLLGRKVQDMLGAYGEILGGSVLCGFGLLTIFGS